MVEKGLLLQHSDLIPVYGVHGGGSMHARLVPSLHSPLPPQLPGAPSLAAQQGRSNLGQMLTYFLSS